MVGHQASCQDVEAGLESAGVTVVPGGPKSFAAQRNGVGIFTYSFDPPDAQWADPALEAFLRMVLEYGEMAHALQQNRGPSTFGLRASLRDRLDLSPLLEKARGAQVVVRESKHLTVKDYFFRHPAFGEFVQVNVLRGQSHVVDVTFSARPEHLAITYSLSVTDACRQAAVAKPPRAPRKAPDRARKGGSLTSGRPNPGPDYDPNQVPVTPPSTVAPDLMDQFADRPLPRTQEEADALMADVFSAALGRRVERRPVEPGEAARSSRRLMVSADGTVVGFVSIGAALAEATAGDEILVRPGDYRESLVIDKAVTIRGDGARELVVIRPRTRGEPCVSITADAPHLSGLSIRGDDLHVREDVEPVELIRVTGGAPVLEALDIAAGDVGVSISGPQTAGMIRSCAIHDGQSDGIQVWGGASPQIEQNEVWANAHAGMAIGGAGTDPLVRANRVHDHEGVGIYVDGGAKPRIEENEVWADAQGGITVQGSGTDPLVRANRVHDEEGPGIFVVDGAAPLLESNDVWGSAKIGIAISGIGTDPIVRANRVHDGQVTGIEIRRGASPRIEDNEVFGNAHSGGIVIYETGSNPLVISNRVYRGTSGGIIVMDGAAPQIEANDVWGNAKPGMMISGAGTAPLVQRNRVHDGESAGIFVLHGASPRIEENEVWGNAQSGIVVRFDGTEPTITQNRLHDNGGEDIHVVDGAKPISSGNITGQPSRKRTAQGSGPADIKGRSYDDVIAGVQNELTGDFKHDGALITSVAQSCGDHPQAKEIRRELGRMLAAIAPDDVKAKFDQITDGYEGGFEPGLAEARAQMRAGKFAEARTLLEDLIGRYGAGTGLFLDDSVSEYRHFANEFEVALYAHLHPSTKHLRKLPQDRAALYTDYGAVLLELRDPDGAEAALREALRVNPVSTDAMFELGEVMKLTGRKREFRELTLRALSVAYSLVTLARAYRNLGYLAVEEEDFDLAVACYCMSLAIDRNRAQAAQSELSYIQQVTGRRLDLPDRQTVEAMLARNGIQVGPSPLVRQLMDSSTLTEPTST